MSEQNIHHQGEAKRRVLPYLRAIPEANIATHDLYPVNQDNVAHWYYDLN